MTTAHVDAWLGALADRHMAPYSTQELSRALRALSVRYVERRQTLAAKSPLDSAGKRAAFAAFYGPLHFLTTREVVHALGLTGQPLNTIVDLGCGTGVASAAWALGLAAPPRIRGVDTLGWAVDEAKWNWRQLKLSAAGHRGDLVEAAERLGHRDARSELARTGIVAAWSVNELPGPSRDQLLSTLRSLLDAGARLLIIEPLARAAAPWWDEWASAFVTMGGRADEWKFDAPLPASVAKLDEAAGFHRESLGARTIWARCI